MSTMLLMGRTPEARRRSLHPLRGRPNLNIADHSCGIPGTEICGRNFHIQQIRKIARSAAVHHRVVQGQRLAIGHRGLPGKPNHGQTIRPVGSDFKLHHVVVQPKAVRISRLASIPWPLGRGPIPIEKSRLPHCTASRCPSCPVPYRSRACHWTPLPGVFPFLYGFPRAGCCYLWPPGPSPPGKRSVPCDNLKGSAFSHIHLTNPHVIGVFMALDLHHAANHHVGNFFPFYLCNLHLGARRGSYPRQKPVFGLHGDKLIQPFS